MLVVVEKVVKKTLGLADSTITTTTTTSNTTSNTADHAVGSSSS